MGRRVITKKDIYRAREKPYKPPSEEEERSPVMEPKARPLFKGEPLLEGEDDYTTKLIKYIPAEIIAAFVAVDGIIRSTDGLISIGIYWIIFFVLVIFTPLYILRVTTDPTLPPSKSQIIISTISFFIWVFALGGPFNYYDWYQPVYGALILPIYTLAIPIVVGK